MLKSVVLCIVLWHEMCEFSGHATQSLNDTSIPNSPAIVLPKINYIGRQFKSKANYTVNITQNIFYVNGTLLGRSDLGRDLRSINNVSRPDYLVTNGIGAHKLHIDNRSWDFAREVCIDEGGDLAIIRSELEERIVLRMMARLAVDEAWIGFHANLKMGDWISVLGEPLGETGWSKEVAWNPAHNVERCAKLLSERGRLMSDGCYFTRSFVCKISTF